MPDRSRKLFWYRLLSAAIAIVVLGIVTAVGARWWKSHCIERNLRNLHVVWLQYRQSHENQGPLTIDEMLKPVQISPEKLLHDPFSDTPRANAYFMFQGATRHLESSKPEFLFGYQEPNQTYQGVYVVLTDGTVAWVSRDQMLW